MPSRNLVGTIPEAAANDYTFYIKNDVSPFAFIQDEEGYDHLE